MQSSHLRTESFNTHCKFSELERQILLGETKPVALCNPNNGLRTGLAVSNIVMTPGVIPVNMLSARSKLAGAASTVASNLSKTDLEFLPNSEKNIQDKGAYVVLQLHEGRGWLLANWRGARSWRSNPTALGRGLRVARC